MSKEKIVLEEEDFHEDPQIELRDIGEEVDPAYGTDYVYISEEQINALKDEKVLILNILSEYRVAIKILKNTQKV